jgi:hypothetical protein
LTWGCCYAMLRGQAPFLGLFAGLRRFARSGTGFAVYRLKVQMELY